MLRDRLALPTVSSQSPHMRKRYEIVKFAKLPTSLRPISPPAPNSPSSIKIA